MRVIGLGILTILSACGEEEPKTEDLSMYCGESDANNLIAEDGDCDGTVTTDDCDDNDPDSLTVAEDGDCDGVPTPDDCNDLDPDSLTVAEDGDCDGVLTADDCDDSDASDASLSGDCDDDGYGQSVDCDDNDATSTFTGIDGDCDGTVTSDDCDDNDPDSLTIAEDGDCDGTVTADDCDDSDAVSTVVAEDGDCDGTVTVDDCDDNDPVSLTRFEDGDCDGVVTADDCDDSDVNSTVVASDMDCDGALDADECDAGAGIDIDTDGDCDDDGYGQIVDCDDNDATSTFIAIDGDCDGTVTADDCDDNDPISLTTVDDADCDGALDIDECDAGVGIDTDTDGDCDDDGVLAIDDCDDDDSSLLEVAFDGDCDGVITALDCNDSDSSDAVLSGDCDQDGVNASVDCDDTDVGLGSTVLDNDCDGVLTGDDCDDSDNTDASLSGDCDADGVPTAADCDDTDTALGNITFDADCDGVTDIVCGGALELEQNSAFCYTDVDGDGYGDNAIVAGNVSPGCYYVSISGEAWGYYSSDMHRIVGYEDGVVELYLEHDHYATTPDYEYETQSTTYCPANTTSLVELEFEDGYGIAQYEVYYDNGDSTQFIASGTHSMGDHTILSESWPTSVTMPVYGTDCDDTNADAHPGAADLDSTTECLTDSDGDGYGERDLQTCYVLRLDDSNYLNWNDNYVSVLEDGVETAAYYSTAQYPDTSVDYIHCVDASVNQFDVVFNAVSGNGPSGTATGSSFGLYYQTDSGDVSIGNGYISGANTFIYESTTATSGSPFFTESAPLPYAVSQNAGTDCDDTDANIGSNAFDADCDGVSTADDCDDSDPNNTMINTYDADCDGTPTADDCNDNDPFIYPGAAYNEPDVNGDNIIDCTRDADGDGYAASIPEQCLEFTMSAYDIDSSDGHGIAVFVDGYLEDVVYFDEDITSEILCVTGTDFEFVVMPYGNGLGNTFAGASGTIENETGTISESFSASINSATSLSFNGTSYGPGDTFYTVTPVENYELGTDCDDDSETTYPGAAYNETGALTGECLQDADGDGFGAENLIACYEVQMENATNAVNGWPSGVYIEALVDTGLGVYSSTNFRMSGLDGSTKTESLCVPEGTYVEFKYQANVLFGTNLGSVYADIVGVTGTTEVTMSGTHNSSVTFLQTMRQYNPNSGSYSVILDGALMFSDFSSPASTNTGGTDSDDGDDSVH